MYVVGSTLSDLLILDGDSDLSGEKKKGREVVEGESKFILKKKGLHRRSDGGSDHRCTWQKRGGQKLWIPWGRLTYR